MQTPSDIEPHTADAAQDTRLRVCVIGLGGGGFHWEVQKIIQCVRQPLELVLVYAGPGGGLIYWNSKDRVKSSYVVRSPSLTGDPLPAKLWRTLHNLYQAMFILMRERPDLVLGVGTAQAVPFGIAARVLRIPHLFAESITRAKRASRTALLVNRFRLSTRFYFYWTELEKFFRWGTCIERDEA